MHNQKGSKKEEVLMKKFSLALAALTCLACFTFLTACRQEEAALPQDENYPYEVTRSTLYALIEKKPSRVVSLSPSLTEIICDLGYEDRLIAVGDRCEGIASSSLALCGTAQAPNMAVILAARPQVLFSSASLTETDLITLQQNDIQAVILPRAEDVEDLFALYDTIGQIFEGGKDGLAAAQSAYQKNKSLLDAYAQAVSGLEEIPAALYLTEDDYTAATGDTFEGKLLEYLGMENLAAGWEGWTIPEDARASLNPNVVFYDPSINLSQLVGQPGYSTSDALQLETFWEADTSAIARQGFSMFSAVFDMLDLAYPDLEISIPEEEPSLPGTSEEEALEEGNSPEDEDTLEFSDELPASREEQERRIS